MKVVVFGSINMDLVVTTPRLPRAGETITGHAFTTLPGGKGANQAVAAARLGASTVMVGRVGNDAFAGDLRRTLALHGVDSAHVTSDPTVNSGVALIAVDDAAENSIVIVPGANGRVDAADAAGAAALLAPGDVLLLQLEVPLSAVMAAATAATARGATVILDPAPARPLPDALLRAADIVTPNESEASLLTGVTVADPASAAEAADRLLDRGCRHVLVTLGRDGALWRSAAERRHLPPYPVRAIDTVAAGDACNGGIAAGLCAGLPLSEALQWGMAAGALATTRRGAQDAMPDRAEVLELMTAER